MTFKTTLLAAVAAVAVSAMGASAATTLNIGTDINVVNFPDGSTHLGFEGGNAGLLWNDDYTVAPAINLQDATAFLFDPDLFGFGTLTFTTYVDPFAPFGQGAANVLLRAGTAFAPGASVTVQWGTGPVVELVNAGDQLISTIFSASEEAGAQDLVFTWSGLETVRQLSGNINVSPVPLPAGLLLLTTALGGLGLARRRRKHDA